MLSPEFAANSNDHSNRCKPTDSYHQLESVVGSGPKPHAYSLEEQSEREVGGLLSSDT